jgi:hypothetical protein
MKWFLFLLCTLLAARLMSSGPIESLQPGQWYEVPNSHMSALDPCPARNCAWSGASGQFSVVDTWSSAAFDTKRDRLLLWGGGHGSYAGNEIYAFDLNTLQWIRVTDPAPDVSGVASMPEYPPWNGLIQPRSCHTYEYIEYLASMDRFCSFGFASPYPEGGQGGNAVHCFDFSTKKWERRNASPGWGIAAISAYDPVTGHGWVKGTDSHSWLAEFAPESGSIGKWFKRSSDSTDFYYKYLLTMDIDPIARKLVAVGGGEVWYWDIVRPATGVSQSLVTTAGATSIVGEKNPGLAYDPVTGKILGWSSGQDIYSLDVPTKVWTKTTPGGANPGQTASVGTYGHFRYSPLKNVFVVVNSTLTNVFIYRHTAGSNVVEAKAIAFKEKALSAFPNPFFPATRLVIDARNTMQKVTFVIYDVRGRVVETLFKDRFLSGRTEIAWQPKEKVNGTFIAKLTMGREIVTRKLFVLQ